MKVLEIGGGVSPRAHLAWKDAEIVTMDADPQYDPDILCDAGQLDGMEDCYDAILAAHVLEHFGWYRIKDVLEGWVKLLKPGGELYVIVPSLEWACSNSEKYPFQVQPHLFGGQLTEWQIHKCMFTGPLLTAFFHRVGLESIVLATTPYTFLCLGERVDAEEHHVRGIKNDNL